ncbi:MAG TPA: hypothetical protein VHC20_07205 [Candidatus Paceibacterota bacterium]|jgi:hypothetical protein|nr:hypothetical protein [Candidatus Paceibacterota bacterium]
MPAPLIDKKLADVDVAQRLKTAYRAVNAALFLRGPTHVASGRGGAR